MRYCCTIGCIAQRNVQNQITCSPQGRPHTYPTLTPTAHPICPNLFIFVGTPQTVVLCAEDCLLLPLRQSEYRAYPSMAPVSRCIHKEFGAYLICILPNISRNYRTTSGACTFISNDQKRKAMIIFFRAVASIRINGTSIMYVRIYLALAGPTC